MNGLRHTVVQNWCRFFGSILLLWAFLQVHMQTCLPEWYSVTYKLGKYSAVEELEVSSGLAVFYFYLSC